MILHLLYTLLLTATDSTNALDPVVLVPGVFGSQLDVWYNKTTAPHYFCSLHSGGWTNMWLCFECMIPKVIDCWVDNMLLNFTDNTFVDRDGFRSRTNDFGGTEGIECLDQHCYYPYFKAIVNSFVAAGYERGVSLRAAPYDFRHGANTPTGKLYLTNLRKLIEDTYEKNGLRKVNIIGHSMGNIFLVEFFKTVDASWKSKYIRRFISISGVYGGSVKSIRALVSGETESIPRIFVDGNTVRAFQRTSQSIYWLLPREYLWGTNESIVFTENRNYTAYEIDELLDDAGFPEGKARLKTIENMTALVDPGVDVYCIHGADIPTAAGFRWRPGYFPDYQPIQINGPGDGTVGQRSLQLCKKFKKLQDYKIYSGAKFGDHMQILLNPDMIEYVKNIVLAEIGKNGRESEELDY